MLDVPTGTYQDCGTTTSPTGNMNLTLKWSHAINKFLKEKKYIYFAAFPMFSACKKHRGCPGRMGLLSFSSVQRTPKTRAHLKAFATNGSSTHAG